MKNPIIEFLAAYGPQPGANNMYDEFVSEAEEKTKCKPITIQQELIEKVSKKLLEETKTIILTGTAGDGKTYLARKIVQNIIGEYPKWEKTQTIYEMKHDSLALGSIKIIKDLSELSEREKDKIYPDIKESLTGENQEVFIICVNDGHLLRFFRERENDVIKNKLGEMLQEDQETCKELNVTMYNLSRQAHAEIFDEIISKIVDHESWEQCTGCPALYNQENPCPIRANRNILAKTGPDSMRQKLIDLVILAAGEERHLSIRHLILLIVNILLGDSHPGSRLLSCTTARRRANENQYDYTNPYANVFGENLQKSDREQFGVFDVMRQFQVGYETTNYFDYVLLAANNQKELPECDIYGERIFSEIRKKYHDSRNEENTSNFLRSIINQRRRLFFSLDPNDSVVQTNPQKDPWRLTIYNFGGCYIETVNEDPSQNPLSRFGGQILLGLNRMMTGWLTDTSKNLWITQPNSVYKGKSTPLLVVSTSTRDYNLDLDHKDAREKGKPLKFLIQNKQKKDFVIALTLRPTIFECIFRVASRGALPANFSLECRKEIENFRIKVADKIQEQEQADRSSCPKVIEMDNGMLDDKPIEILEEQPW